MDLFFLIKNTIVLVLGSLLIAYASVNITLSSAPDNIDAIPQNYGKTFALKVTPITDSPDETKNEIKISSRNAYILMILSMIAGIYLVLDALSEIFICKFYKIFSNK